MPRQSLEKTPPIAGGNPLHIFALWGFAVVQPLLSVLADEPTFFLVRGSRAADVLALLLLVAVVVPLPLAALSHVSRVLGARLHRLIHGGLIALLLFAIFLVPAYHSLERSAAAPIALALLLAAAGLWLYRRYRAIRQYATLLLVAVPIFAAGFLWNSGIRKIVVPGTLSATPLAAVSSPIPVVVVVLDELPLLSLMNAEGRIDPIRYPNLARLAGDGTWYPRATAAADSTQISVPALLTGSYPDRRGIAVFRDHPNNLFTLLAASHELRVQETLSQLCPPELCRDDAPPLSERLLRLVSDLRYLYLHILLPPRLTDGLPSVVQNWQDFGRRVAPPAAGTASAIWQKRQALFARDRASRFLDFVAGLRRGDRPPLIYLHTLLPHAPWTYLSSGVGYPTGAEPAWGDNNRWVEDEALVRESQLRHLMQLARVDALLGRLWLRLEELELYDSSLIVVTADHGIVFDPGGFRRRLTLYNARDVIGVPLIIKAPSQVEGAIDMRSFAAVDLLPTIASHLGFEIPWPIDGLSALDPKTPVERPVIGMSGKKRDPLLTLDPKFDYQTGLDRKIHFFGSGAEPLYRAAPRERRRLIGRRAARLALDESSGARFELSLPESAFELEPEMRIVPARLAGTLLSSDLGRRRLDLAVAVNGTLRAVARVEPSYLEEGFCSFLLDESAYAPGRNRVEFYLVEGSRGSWNLRPVEAEFAAE